MIKKFEFKALKNIILSKSEIIVIKKEIANILLNHSELIPCANYGEREILKLPIIGKGGFVLKRKFELVITKRILPGEIGTFQNKKILIK